MDNKIAQILIVDDHPNNLRFLSKVLSSKGYQIQRAISGELALTAVRECQPDLILLDIMMPEMNGYEVCQRLKSCPETSHIPIIFLSALSQICDKIKAFELGGVDYITKPFQIEEVLARIENQLTIQNLSKQLKEQNAQLQQEIESRKQVEAQLRKKSRTLAEFSLNLKQLHRLNTKNYSNFEELFNEYLQTGCEILGFSTGIISQINDQTYRILAVKSDLLGLNTNQIFNVGDTYCAAVVATKKTIGYERVGKVPKMQTHPVYRNLKLESYIGTPIWVNGEIYGTLNFSSTQVREQTFAEREREIIELMAQSLGMAIAAYQTEIKRQQAEERLRLLDRAIAVAKNGMMIIDTQAPDYPIVYVNSGFERITGYSREEAIGKNCHFLQGNDTDQPALDELRRAIAVGEEGQFILRNYRKDGTLFWNELSITPIRDATGCLMHYIGVQTDITERKQGEEALKKSEERWQLVLRGNNDGLFDWNIKTNEVFISARLKEMLGYDIQKTILNFDEWHSRVHSEDLAMATDSLQAYLKRKSPHYMGEYRLRSKDGSYKWILARGQAQWDEAGQPVRMVGSLQDITLRKQAEEQLRASQQKLSFLLQNVPLAIIEWNTQGEVVAWNQAAESIFGYSAAEMIGAKGFSLLFPERARGQAKTLWEQLLTQESSDRSISENVTKAGKIIICEWYNTPLIDQQGCAIGAASIAVDITERQQRELLEKTQKTVLEMVAQGRSLHDVLLELTTQVDRLTPQMYSSILLMAEDGEHLHPYVGPKIPPTFVAAINPLRIGPTVGSCGTAAYFGKRVIVDDIATNPLWAPFKDLALPYGLRACWSEPILSNQGKVLGTFALYFTEVRSPEDRELAVIESLARLASLVIERKQAEVALQKAKEAAETANRAKSDFLASMSHELRTPLNAILGFSQILAHDHSLTSQQRSYLGIINRSGEHLLELINDILSMSKIEAGRITLTENSFDLHGLLDSLEEMLRLKANSKGLQLTFKRDSDIPQYVTTDESKLRQVLINLLGNAIKFTPQGGEVRLTARPGKDDHSARFAAQDRTVEISVADTGIGIP
ncbi:MAG TPA: hypothetical protein DDZ80_29195, partial [Cyanobacteria bacterium UBA8803]|nr:hypothetical protein [Cyanobacteria bacterium UBA8803]